MLFLLISVTVIAVSQLGMGVLFGRLIRYTPRNPWIYWWLGFFVTSTLAMLVSFFAPLNLIVLAVLGVLGLTGFPLWLNQYKVSLSEYPKSDLLVFCFISLLFILGISCLFAYRGEIPKVTYDTDLYHAQTIRWLNEYGTVPGIGNLHARLGFNTSWHTFAALIDNGFWDNRSAFFMPLFAWTGAFFYFFHELFFTRNNAGRVYALCILFWIAWMVLKEIVPGLEYDQPVHIVNAMVILESWYFLETLVEDKKQITGRAACIMALGMGAFLIKPIGAVSLVFAGLLSFVVIVRNSKKIFPSLLIVFMPAVFALGIWIIRNMYLSGYPVYPLPVFALPFDWTMPYGLAKDNYDFIIAWARLPGPDYRQALEKGFLFWFKPWLMDPLYSRSFLVLVGFPFPLSLFLWFLVIRFLKTGRALLFFSWTNLCIVYWFISAPGLRFGAPFFLVSLGASCLFLFSQKSFEGILPGEYSLNISVFWKRRFLRWTFLYLWILAVTGLITLTVVSSKRSLISIDTLQSRPVKKYTVNATVPFKVWIPEEGNNPITGNSPLPSTAYPPSNLEMRTPGNLADGFRPAERL